MHNLTIITGLQGFIKSGLYKELDDTYASYLLENLTSIANKDLKYRGKAINDFFAKDFADREIERLQTGNLDSLGIKESKNNARNIDIIADKNLEQGKNKMIKIEVLAENKDKKSL